MLKKQYMAEANFEPPAAFSDLINRIHTTSVATAQQQLTYESLYDFPKQAEYFRTKLRRIDQRVDRIPRPHVSDQGTVVKQRSVHWTYTSEQIPALRQVLDTIAVMKQESSLVSEDVVELWMEGNNRPPPGD